MWPWEWSHTEQFFAVAIFGGYLIWVALKEIGRVLVAILECLQNIEKISKDAKETLDRVAFDADKIKDYTDRIAFTSGRIESDMGKHAKWVDDNLESIKYSASQIETYTATTASVSPRAGGYGTDSEQEP